MNKTEGLPKVYWKAEMGRLAIDWVMEKIATCIAGEISCQFGVGRWGEFLKNELKVMNRIVITDNYFCF